MTERLFTDENAWLGGFFEVALELGPRSDDRLLAALTALWRFPDLDGWYLENSSEPTEQSRSSEFCLESGSHCFGVANLPNGSRVACGSVLIREEEGSDWLDFYLPMGALGTAYPCGGFPFGTEADWPGPWRFEVEDWLARVGLWVAQSVSYRLGTIGHEVSGQVDASEIASKGVPDARYIGYLWPTNSTVMYYRRTAS